MKPTDGVRNGLGSTSRVPLPHPGFFWFQGDYLSEIGPLLSGTASIPPLSVFFFSKRATPSHTSATTGGIEGTLLT